MVRSAVLSTRHKILIARSISTTTLFLRELFGLPSEVVATRRGLTWSLNLKEGIDLAIYLLGGFEVRVLRKYAQVVRQGDVVLDIGANVGAHTLPLAQLVGPRGKVFSFEPTAYAFAKLQTNIALNSQLASRIESHQMMLMATDTENLPESVYSSWPLEKADDLHHEHHGRLMPTNGATQGTLDSFLARAGIEKVNFIKVDVDGNEADVLKGAKSIIQNSKPQMMLELAPYVYRNNPNRFDEFLESLWREGYEMSDVVTRRPFPNNPIQVRALIPEAGGVNVLATYKG